MATKKNGFNTGIASEYLVLSMLYPRITSPSTGQTRLLPSLKEKTGAFTCTGVSSCTCAAGSVGASVAGSLADGAVVTGSILVGTCVSFSVELLAILRSI